MTKTTTTILLLVLLQVQQFNRAWIQLLFAVNQASIAKTLCVKRAEKNNTCKGRCFLKKQLQAASQEEANTPSKKETAESFYLFQLISSRPVFYLLPTPYFQHPVIDQSWTQTAAERGLFRPPKV